MHTKAILRYLVKTPTNSTLFRYAAFPTRNQRRFNTTLQGLPFKISLEEANKEFSKHQRFLEQSNGDAKTKALNIFKQDPVKACFVPFHSADVKNLSSSYVGQYGEDYTVTTYSTSTDANGNSTITSTTTTYTNWYDWHGTTSPTDYPFGIKQTQIYADFNYPRILIEKILPTYDVVQIAALTKDMVLGEKIVYPHTMNMSLALEKLSARLYNLEQARAEEHIKQTVPHRVDRVRIHALDVHMQNAKFDLFSYHIPAYIYESKIGDLASYKIINAFNGEIYGNKIYSVIKSALFGAGLGGSLTFVASALTRPYLLVPEIFVRIVLGSVASGAFAGALARFRNYSNNYNFQFTTKSEMEHNASYPESEDDITRREFAAKMNKENDYTINSEHIHLPTDKCKLFGLNPENEITIETLQEARRKKLKTWHPDMFRDNVSKEKAEAMTKQLNAAYSELEDILKTHTK